MLRALLPLLGLLGAALTSPVSGPQECAKGPAVWCQDLQVATRCGAVGHCQSAIWSKPTAKTLPCDVCLDVTAASSHGLNPHATETDILALMMKTCEWLPSQESSAKCKGMVDAHHSAILSMLGGAPAQLCAALTLCQPLPRHPASPGPLSEEDISEVVAPLMANGPLSFHPPQIPGDAVCQDCVQLVTQLQVAVGSNLSHLAETITQEQCESLEPGLALLCKNYIRQFFAPTEQTLRLAPPKEICRKRGFCEELREPALLAHTAAGHDDIPSLEPVSPRKKSEIQMKSGLTCELCLEVVQELDQWLESNSTETMISHTLKRVCSKMPAPIVQQCVTLVDTYSPSLVQLVASVAPEKVCKAIRLCRSQRQARAVHEDLATVPSPVLGQENRVSFCNGCKRLFGVSARNLERKSTKRNILMAFQGGCSILPLTYMIQCKRFVTEYEPVLVESLMEMMDPEALCMKMGACHTPRTSLLGMDQCVMGPNFWCKSWEAAELCGAVEHCQRHMWKVTPFRAGEHA